MTAFQPHLSASRVDRLLKESLAELQGAEKSAALWFAEVLNRRLYRELGHSSMHQYAALELGFSRSRTAQFIRLAGSLHDLPGLRRSLARGEVSWTKAREVARVATPRTEKTWIDHARRSTSRELERKVSATKRAARAIRTGSSNQGRLMEASGGAVGAGRDLGATRAPETSCGYSGATEPAALAALAAEVPVGLHLRFSPAQYARYEALMEKLRKMGGRGSREELLLAAMETAVLSDPPPRGGAAAIPERGTVKEAGSGKETGLAEEAGPGEEAGCGKGAGSSRTHTAQIKRRVFPRGNTVSPYQVVVQVCERCETGSVETGRGSLTLSPEALKAILCDAKIRRQGKTNRSAVPAGVRRRVLERDRFRCRAAGCTGTRFLSVHHLVPRETGGPNRPDNLITLCDGCHRAAHRAGNAGPWSP